MKNNRGFTLIELAIVLVIIGVLAGAVLQGQKMLYNARMDRIVSDMRNYAQMFLVYYDRHGMYPGDEDDAAFPTGDTADGDHDGRVDPGEAANVWEDLNNSMGLVRNSSPVRGGVYTFGNSADFAGVAFDTADNKNFIAVSNVPNIMAQAIDSRHDNGTWNTGNIQASAAYDGSETLITFYWRI